MGASLVLTGCVVIPVNSPSPGSRRNVTEATESLLQRGTLTKEEVLLLLGEPDDVSEDGQRFGYAWRKVRAIIATVGGAVHMQRGYLLQVWFDASAHVVQVGTVEDEMSLLIPHSIAITAAGTGRGLVTSVPVGITCGPACSASFATGTLVILTATPAPDSVFAGWGGACAGAWPCTLTLTVQDP